MNSTTRDRNDVYKLERLDDYHLVNPDEDLRGRTLMTPQGDRVGRIDDMLVDLDRERVAALRLEDDRVVDIDHVDLRENNKPVLLVPNDRIPRPGADFDRNNVTSEVIPIIEEELVVGKRDVERGHVRVRSRTVEQPAHEQVMLREEHVDVDRRKVDERIDPREADRMLRDRDVSMTATSEEAVVAKEARVVEELVVSKSEDNRTEQIHDTVRRTEVDVDSDLESEGSRRR